MKNIQKSFLVLTLFISLSTNAQSLNDLLWERVSSCNEVLVDPDDETKKNYEVLVDDAKNGYLKIGGSFPTCGCECYHTVGAFKTAAGEYVLIDKSEWSCGWKQEINASKPIWSVLPPDIAMQIIGYAPKREFAQSYFYLDLEIPQHGTKTKLNVGFIPFGIETEPEMFFLTTQYKEEGSVKNYALYNIAEIIKKFDYQTLELIMNEKLDQLSEKDKSILDNYIKTSDYDSGHFGSYEEISQAFGKLKDIYNQYSKLKAINFTLDWDREKEQFYIVDKGESPKEMSFQEFLEILPFWMPMC